MKHLILYFKNYSILNGLLLSVVMSLGSCTTQKDNYKENKVALEKGFEYFEIIQNSDRSCPFFLVSERKDTLDPVNAHSFIEETQKEVWLKYRRLRRQNRCGQVPPVEIVEVYRP